MKLHELSITALPFGAHQGRFFIYAQISIAGDIPLSDILQQLQDACKQYTTLPIYLDFARTVKSADIQTILMGILPINNRLAARGWWTRAEAWMPQIHTIQRLNIKDWVGIPFAELHVTYDDPTLLDDNILVPNTTSLYIQPAGKAQFQDVINFVTRSKNEWKILLPPKFDLTKSLLKETTPS